MMLFVRLLIQNLTQRVGVTINESSITLLMLIV